MLLVGLALLSAPAYGQSSQYPGAEGELKTAGEQQYYERYGTYDDQCVEEYHPLSNEPSGLVCSPYAPDSSDPSEESGPTTETSPERGPINFGSDYPGEETTEDSEETVMTVDEPDAITAPSSQDPEQDREGVMSSLYGLLSDSGGFSAAGRWSARCCCEGDDEMEE